LLGIAAGFHWESHKTHPWYNIIKYKIPEIQVSTNTEASCRDCSLTKRWHAAAQPQQQQQLWVDNAQCRLVCLRNVQGYSCASWHCGSWHTHTGLQLALA
jgi:hypothetical protein